MCYLFQHGADIDVFTEHNLSPVFLASHKGHADCVKRLVEVAKDRGKFDGKVIHML